MKERMDSLSQLFELHYFWNEAIIHIAVFSPNTDTLRGIRYAVLLLIKKYTGFDIDNNYTLDRPMCRDEGESRVAVDPDNPTIIGEYDFR